MKVGVYLQYSKNDMPAEKNKMLGMVLFFSVENEWFEWSVWGFYFFVSQIVFCCIKQMKFLWNEMKKYDIKWNEKIWNEMKWNEKTFFQKR